jgi:hypothetical protein
MANPSRNSKQRRASAWIMLENGKTKGIGFSCVAVISFQEVSEHCERATTERVQRETKRHHE